MGVSHKSHGKRSDKETQSPMLKIFKDIMQKESKDPEKTNLLNGKHVDRKRKLYSGCRSKSGHHASNISSSSDHQKPIQTYNMDEQDLKHADVKNSRSRSIPFQSEKHDSWWFWKDTDAKSKAEDTCSCVSCLLKKFISTDYACMACLTLLLIASASVAIMLIYKSVPCTTNINEHTTFKMPYLYDFTKPEGDRLKRKIGNLGVDWNFNSKKLWKNPFTRTQDSFDDSGWQDDDMSNLVDPESDLSRILDSQKINDIQSSERLKDFYRKLMQTDAAIRNLRKTLENSPLTNTDNFDANSKMYSIYNNKNFPISNIDVSSNIDLNGNIQQNSNTDQNGNIIQNGITDFEYYPDRKKRSANFFHRPARTFLFKNRDPKTNSKIDHGRLITKTTVNMTANKKPNKSQRNKRFDDSQANSFIIEKNKFLIQYNPGRIVPKCSHAPKESKIDETQLKHPFYKNTQRIDDLLDQFMDKKLPDLFSDPFEINTFRNDNINKYNHPENREEVTKKDEKSTNQAAVNEKTDQNNMEAFAKVENTPQMESKQIVKTEVSYRNNFMEDSEGIDTKTEKSSTNTYDILLSISTLINPALKRTSKYSNTVEKRAPGSRKLMQVNAKDEEGIAYEDLKEVLSDSKEGHDDEDKENDQKKRNFQEVKKKKRFPVDINNPNWKGAMPLYPDELTQMIKQRPDPNDILAVPVHSRDSAPEADEGKRSLTDVEYVENYLDDGYEKLIELAQAYSDYGVLNEKKQSDTERKTGEKNQRKLDDGRVRLAMGGFKRGLKRRLKKNNFFGRHIKGTKVNDEIKGEESEGIRIELHPNPTETSDGPINLRKILEKHVKISYFEPTEKSNSANLPQTVLHEPNSHVLHSNVPCVTSRSDKLKSTANNKELHETSNIAFKKRKLKSIDLKNENDQDVDRTEEEFYNEPDKPNKFKRDTDKLFNLEDQTKGFDEVSTIMNENNEQEISVKHTNTIIPQKDSIENNMTMSEFFLLLSNWFSVLDGLEVTTKKSETNKALEFNVLPSEKLLKKGSNVNDSKRSEMSFPMYDSDMIENIGHRSRVLLSVDITNNTVKDLLTSEDHADVHSTTEPMTTKNITNLIQDTTKVIKENITNENTKNRRKVKRQAIDDSNLIFWNDLYDDEYGIEANPMEDNIRDKHSIDNDFLRKSNTWFHDKVKKFGKKLNFPTFHRENAIKQQQANDGIKLKRDVKYEDVDTNGKIDFAALTAKMKAVCKKTVEAVQKTNHVQTRADGKENMVATSLMQQLVRLMTDLVDFQVQERTCRKLPPDLQKFLEWLTSDKEKDNQPDSYFSNKQEEDQQLNMNFDKSTEQDLLQPSERENPDSKTDCLGTLHAVQDLMRQYEDMSEDDKSIMTGVKDYLERQMNFLQNQLSTFDENMTYNQDGLRFRRDLILDVGHTVANSIEATAHTIDYGYKKLKHAYHKMNKLKKKVFKKVNKLTTEPLKEDNCINSKVTTPHYLHEMVNKNYESKLKQIEENDNLHAGSKDKDNLNISNNEGHIKDKTQLKGKDHLKDKTQLEGKNHLKDKTQLEGKDHLRDKTPLEGKDHLKDKTQLEGKDHLKDKTQLKGKDHKKDNIKGKFNIKEAFYNKIKPVIDIYDSGMKNDGNHESWENDDWKALDDDEIASEHKHDDLFDNTEILRIIE